MVGATGPNGVPPSGYAGAQQVQYGGPAQPPPMAPITPTFPLFGPLGALPYPVGYRIIYGKPLDFSDRFGPEAADDSRVVEYLTKKVRRSVQQLVDTHR